MLLSFLCSDYFFPYYRISQSETKGPHDIHSLRSSCFIKTSAFNVAGNLAMVVKFMFQSVFGNSRRNPRQFNARSRGVTRAVFYPFIWLANIKTKGFTSRKSFCRSGWQTLFFGGKEGTTRNAFAVRRLHPTPSPPQKKKLPQWLIKGHLIPYPAFWLRHWITLGNLIHKINSCKQCKNNYSCIA